MSEYDNLLLDMHKLYDDLGGKTIILVHGEFHGKVIYINEFPPTIRVPKVKPVTLVKFDNVFSCPEYEIVTYERTQSHVPGMENCVFYKAEQSHDPR